MVHGSWILDVGCRLVVVVRVFVDCVIASLFTLLLFLFLFSFCFCVGLHAFCFWFLSLCVWLWACLFLFVFVLCYDMIGDVRFLILFGLSVLIVRLCVCTFVCVLFCLWCCFA